MYEIHNVDFHVLYTMMACFIEVSSYDVVRRVLGNIVEMGLEAVHQSTFSLAHILHSTYFAGYAVYEVGRLAAHIVFGDICSPCRFAHNLPSCIDFWAISAIFSFADIFYFGFIDIRSTSEIFWLALHA